MRILNPFDASLVVESVKETRNLLVIDAGWLSAGFSAEVIARVSVSYTHLTLPTTPYV